MDVEGLFELIEETVRLVPRCFNDPLEMEKTVVPLTDCR